MQDLINFATIALWFEVSYFLVIENGNKKKIDESNLGYWKNTQFWSANVKGK